MHIHAACRQYNPQTTETTGRTYRHCNSLATGWPVCGLRRFVLFGTTCSANMTACAMRHGMRPTARCSYCPNPSSSSFALKGSVGASVGLFVGLLVGKSVGLLVGLVVGS
jgi:hypothetical protein